MLHEIIGGAVILYAHHLCALGIDEVGGKLA